MQRDLKLMIDSNELVNKQVELTDPDGKYRIGKVVSVRNYDLTVELPEWHHPKDSDGNPVETKRIHTKLRVPKEFVHSQITKRFQRQIIWPPDKRTRTRIIEIALNYKRTVSQKANRHKQKMRIKRKNNGGR